MGDAMPVFKGSKVQKPERRPSPSAVFACVLRTDGRSRALNRAHSGFGPLPCVFGSGFWLAFTEDASAVSFTGNLRTDLPCVCKHGRRCGPWKSLALFNLVEFWLFCCVFCLLVCLLACLR